MEPRERQLRRRYPLGQRRAAGPPAPPRDRSQFTAGGRIQPRAAIRPRAAAATDPMWTPLLAATKMRSSATPPVASVTPNLLLLEIRRAFAAD